MAFPPRLLQLPPEALQRCLCCLRVTELAPGLGACCTSLQRLCRQPEHWRREMELRFPGLPGVPSWRGALMAELRSQAVIRLRQHAATKRRQSYARRDAELCIARLDETREGLRRRLEELQPRPAELRHAAALETRVVQPPAEATAAWVEHVGRETRTRQTAVAPARRAKSARLRAEADETEEILRKIEVEQRQVDAAQLSAEAELSAAREYLALCEAQRREAEARLACLPPPRAAAPVPSRCYAAAHGCHGRPGSRAAAMAAAAGERAAAAAASAIGRRARHKVM